MDKTRYINGRDGFVGKFSNQTDSSITSDLVSWNNFQVKLNHSINSGTTFANAVMTTYSLAYTTNTAYQGGVLSPSDEIHMVSFSATVGQKINRSGVPSTYSLTINGSSGKFIGGVSPLVVPSAASAGNFHFIPYEDTVGRGQRIGPSNLANVVTTYTRSQPLGATLYAGGSVSNSGQIHFVPYSAPVGQIINTAGTVSTYTLAYTTTAAYFGGILAPNGEIHFVPYNATVGQKISTAGTASTYTLAYTTTDAYRGAVLSPNGEIHFVPHNATVGQKVDISGNVSTYSLVYTTTGAYSGGVLAPNGEIYMVPFNARVGQKIERSGTVSTFSLPYTTTNAYSGAVLTLDGIIHFIPHSAAVGTKLSTLSGIPFSRSLCKSPYLNKF